MCLCGKKLPHRHNRKHRNHIEDRIQNEYSVQTIASGIINANNNNWRRRNCS